MKALEDKIGKDSIDQFLKEECIMQKAFQGQHSLEGNQSRSFLKKFDKLRSKLSQEGNSVSRDAEPVIDNESLQ